MNSDERMKSVNEALQLSTVLQDMHNDKMADKQQRQQRRERELAKTLLRREQQKRKADKKRQEALERTTIMIQELDNYGLGHMAKFNKCDLISLIRHFFHSSEYKDNNNKDKKKNQLLETAIKLYNEYKERRRQDAAVEMAQLAMGLEV